MALNDLVQPAKRGRDRDGALASTDRSRPALPGPGRGQPRRLPAQPRHGAEQPAIRKATPGTATARWPRPTEAIQRYRDLAEASPAAFLPDLALALNNLVQPAKRGRGPRRRAGLGRPKPSSSAGPWPQPARAFLPDLAMALSNLVHRQSGAGDRDGAAGLRRPKPSSSTGTWPRQPRRLPAQPRHGAEQPRPSGKAGGDRDGALASVDEAVQIRRDLAAASPAFLPDLALALNNLSDQQSGTGDRDGALASHRSRPAPPGPGRPTPPPTCPTSRSLNSLGHRKARPGTATARWPPAASRPAYRDLASQPRPYLPNLARR